MKTLLIGGSPPIPSALRDLIARGLAANETFVWPRDEDRLKMAFMTGA